MTPSAVPESVGDRSRSHMLPILRDLLQTDSRQHSFPPSLPIMSRRSSFPRCIVECKQGCTCPRHATAPKIIASQSFAGRRSIGDSNRSNIAGGNSEGVRVRAWRVATNLGGRNGIRFTCSKCIATRPLPDYVGYIMQPSKRCTINFDVLRADMHMEGSCTASAGGVPRLSRTASTSLPCVSGLALKV